MGVQLSWQSLHHAGLAATLHRTILHPRFRYIHPVLGLVGGWGGAGDGCTGSDGEGADTGGCSSARGEELGEGEEGRRPGESRISKWLMQIAQIALSSLLRSRTWLPSGFLNAGGEEAVVRGS